jgi:hypothetical protein
MVQIIKDMLDIEVQDFDFLIVTFCMVFIFMGVQYFFSLLTVPVNMITNSFEKVRSKK